MTNRIATLDFLRAFAILTVLMAHIVLAMGAPSYLAPLQFGGSGVTLFFVLSGWLLGNQIFKEYKSTGNINIKIFLLKRWIRTLPPYFLILFLTLFQLYFTNKLDHLPFEYFLFIQNYFSLTFFTVSWSLAVEEQFYLFIAPFILFIFRFNNKYIVLIFLILIFLPLFFRFTGLFSSHYETHVVFDSCLIGVFAAYLNTFYPKIITHFRNNYFYYFLFSTLLYLSFYAARYGLIDFPTQPDNLFLSLIFIFLLLSLTSEKINSTIINNSIITYIALRSYGIYLVHPDAIAISKNIFHFNSFSLVLSSILLSIIFAEIIYVFIEKPLLRNRTNIICTIQNYTTNLLRRI